MTSREICDSLAIGIGYGVMVISAVSMFFFLVAIALDSWWRKLQDIYAAIELQSALREYKRKRSRT